MQKARRVSPRLLPALIALALAGCSIEKPAAPTFETNVYVPFGAQRTTGLDLIRDGDFIGGDSTGGGPLALTLNGTIEEVRVADMLDFDVQPSGFASSIDSVDVTPPDDANARFPFSAIVPGVPPDAESAVLPAFSIPGARAEAEEQGSFRWMRVRTGRVVVTVQNRLSVPLGLAGVPGSFGVRVIDRVDGTLIDEVPLDRPVPPGGHASGWADLAGVSMHNLLDLEIWGESPGSGGEPVPVSQDQGVDLRVEFGSVVADSAIAPVPGQRLHIEQSVPLEENVRLAEGAILGGCPITVVLQNALPIPATAHIRFADVFRGGQPLEDVFAVPPMTGPGGVRFQLEMGDAVVSAPPGTLLSALDYTVDIESPGSDGAEVAIGSRQRIYGEFDRSRLRFDSVRGSIDARRIELAGSETDFEPPEGMEQLGFEAATLTLEVESTVGLGSQADVSVVGTGEGTRVALPLSFVIPPGSNDHPGKVTAVLHQGNSSILDLLRANPRRLVLSGGIRVGDGQVGTLRREDVVRGRYTLVAPLRVRIGRIEHGGDPVRFTVTADNQDRIRENLMSGEAVGRIENHLPAGLTARVFFAADSAGLSSPAVVLDSIAVAPGEVDPATGRVTRAATTEFNVSISEEQIAFLARDEVWMRVMFTIWGSDPDATVEVTSEDYVDFRGMLRLQTRVNP